MYKDFSINEDKCGLYLSSLLFILFTDSDVTHRKDTRAWKGFAVTRQVFTLSAGWQPMQMQKRFKWFTRQWIDRNVDLKRNLNTVTSDDSAADQQEDSAFTGADEQSYVSSGKPV